MPSEDRIALNPVGEFRRLGTCWMVYGIVRLILAVFLFIYSGTATLMFGALLERVPNPFALMADFHFLYVVMAALSALCGILGIIAGVALIGSRPGRTLALIAAFFSLCEIPLGLTLGVYTLIVLLPARAADAHEGARS